MPKRPDRTTIVVAHSVRDDLKHIARKDQTFNQLFIDLIKLYNDSQNVKNKESGSSSPKNADPVLKQTLSRNQPRVLTNDQGVKRDA